jgi:tungstate transport system ATP-binding protein
MNLKLTASNIYKAYKGDQVLKDCSYSFDMPGTYILTGPNGCGKSTFLRICALLENPDKGEVNYFPGDTPLHPLLLRDTSLNPPLLRDTSLNPPLLRGELKGGSENTPLKKDLELRRRITLVLPRVGVFNTSVYKNVSYGLTIRGIRGGDSKEKVNRMLEFVGLSNKRDQNALTLSSGETQRLGIARALIIEPGILFLDEPTTSVDQTNTEIIEDIIMKMKEEHKTTVVVATHDKEQAKRLGDKVLIMNDGRITAQ